MQYLSAASKMTEWSRFVSEANHSTSQWSKSVPQPLIPKKLGWTVLWRPIRPPAAAAKSHQLCLALCDPIHGSPTDSSVPGILQARILEWVAISFSNVWKWKVKVKSLSHFRLLATPWTVAYQAPPSMGFSRQEYWSGVPLPSLLSCEELDTTEQLN